MKVRYINKTDASLINGKIYEVQSVERGDYRIIDETGGERFFIRPVWIWNSRGMNMKENILGLPLVPGSFIWR